MNREGPCATSPSAFPSGCLFEVAGVPSPSHTPQLTSTVKLHTVISAFGDRFFWGFFHDAPQSHSRVSACRALNEQREAGLNPRGCQRGVTWDRRRRPDLSRAPIASDATFEFHTKTKENTHGGRPRVHACEQKRWGTSAAMPQWASPRMRLSVSWNHFIFCTATRRVAGRSKLM